jgi:hypothetical protein
MKFFYGNLLLKPLEIAYHHKTSWDFNLVFGFTPKTFLIDTMRQQPLPDCRLPEETIRVLSFGHMRNMVSDKQTYFNLLPRFPVGAEQTDMQ